MPWVWIRTMFLRDLIWYRIVDQFDLGEKIAIYDAINGHIQRPQGVMLDLSRLCESLRDKLEDLVNTVQREEGETITVRQVKSSLG